MSAAIEIVGEFRLCEKAGNVKAFVTITLGAVTIVGCKIVQQPGKPPWLAMSDRSWTGADGVVRYTSIVELADTLRKRANEAAVAAWEKRR